jgi:biopolymer transport protein ExbD
VTRRSGSKTSSRLNARLLVFVLALNMSATATSGESAEPRDVQLVVTDSGQYILSGRPVALADLRGKLRELKSSGGPINLHIRGGSKVEYKFVMPAMQIAQEEGLSKVGLLTVPPAAPDSSASPR